MGPSENTAKETVAASVALRCSCTTGYEDLSDNMVKFCPRCGKETNGLDVCPYCGWNKDDVTNHEKPTTAYNQAPVKHKSRKVLVIAAVIFALIVAGGIGYVAVESGHHAYIEYKVTSGHIFENVDVTVYVDDTEVGYCDDLEPGQTVHSTSYYTYTFPLTTERKVVEITAVATGGGLGMQTDSEYLTVSDGGHYTVDLVI
ncbi:MAG: hypothetical protein PHF83_04070 [Candidatus Methanomethylophilus sp.]|nr:hypothetical protein [Methanomethylophilus sp.]MDD4668814.1 hypothetical protein [Methanomethylophilus sp.]